MHDEPTLSVHDAQAALREVVCSSYSWPEQPAGWQLKFIVYPDGEVIMDFGHPVSCTFWSEDHAPLQTPYQPNKAPITWQHLKAAKVPFMTTFGQAMVSTEPSTPHLTPVR